MKCVISGRTRARILVVHTFSTRNPIACNIQAVIIPKPENTPRGAYHLRTSPTHYTPVQSSDDNLRVCYLFAESDVIRLWTHARRTLHVYEYYIIRTDRGFGVCISFGNCAAEVFTHARAPVKFLLLTPNRREHPLRDEHGGTRAAATRTHECV